MKSFCIPVGNDFEIRVCAESDTETVDEFINRVKQGLTLENLEAARSLIEEVAN